MALVSIRLHIINSTDIIYTITSDVTGQHFVTVVSISTISDRSGHHLLIAVTDSTPVTVQITVVTEVIMVILPLRNTGAINSLS